MIKLIENVKTKNADTVKPMSEMKPLEVCIVIDGRDGGAVVMRTACSGYDRFEVMNISRTGADSCWTNPPSYIQVRELREGETYTIRLS